MKYLLIFEDNTMKLFFNALTNDDYLSVMNGVLQIVDLNNEMQLNREGEWVKILEME